ncbi:hypothetical protein VTG60DRAFT_674 [Thermothelomyces hinnuleus]
MPTTSSVILALGLLCAGAGVANAGTFSFPLKNGFPFPSERALEELFVRAGGNFTNHPPAVKFDDDSLTSWKLKTFNEFMEVAFFTQLIANITDRVLGYELDPEEEPYILSTLKAIQAVRRLPINSRVMTQEEMHAYNANDAVRFFSGGRHIYPCTYDFPVSDFASAIAFAQTFTDMYIGLLIDIQWHTGEHLGSDGSPPILYVLGQALGQEGQQSGWFRSLQGKPPSAEPFLTASTREFAFSWLQRWVVPGTCPNATGTGAESDIPLPILPRLDVVGEVRRTGRLTLRAPGPVDPDTMRVAYVNGALMPTVLPFEVSHVSRSCGVGERTGKFQMPLWCDDEDVVSTITVDFPFENNVMHGLTLAAVVTNGPTFMVPADVSKATVYGPAVIEVA